MNLLCCCLQIMAPNTNSTKKWELFAGRNRFYCDGLLMSAPHTGVFYLTCFLITGTSTLFFAFDCPYLATRITPAIPIVGALLYFFTMSSLLRTTFTDPGIIPRASHDEAAYIEKQIEVPNSLNSPTYRPPPRTKEVLVKGQVVKLKYCFTCKIFRPPRASHCSLCDNCVDRFDHHCPWVGNCVGKRNYRFFYMFLVSLAFLAVFIFSCSITHLVLLMKNKQEVIEVIREAPFSVIVTIICFFSIWSVIGLAGFHTYLTTSDQTTNEDLKGSFTSKGGQRAINPYSRGNICLNCFHILCGPMTPSLIDRRGVVTDEFILQMQNHSPNNQLTEITTTQQSGMIIHQPMLGGNNIGGGGDMKPRLYDESNATLGMYRHRSYDNLQNGKSTYSPAYRLKTNMQLPYSPSFDRNSPLPLLHRQSIVSYHPANINLNLINQINETNNNNNNNINNSNNNIPCIQQLHHPILQPVNIINTTISNHNNNPIPIPSEFEYYTPQQPRQSRASEASINIPAGYPFHGNRAVQRQGSTQSVDSAAGGGVGGSGISKVAIRPKQPQTKIPQFEIKSPTNRLTLRECDFGGGGEPIDDESVKDSQIFRVSKRNLYMNHRSPWVDRKDRYSNVYEYSFNIDLNSIIEDAAASDSS